MMTDTKKQFLSFIDRCIEDDTSLVVPADEDQLKRLAEILGIARQGIEQYSEALSHLDQQRTPTTAQGVPWS